MRSNPVVRVRFYEDMGWKYAIVERVYNKNAYRRDYNIQHYETFNKIVDIVNGSGFKVQIVPGEHEIMETVFTPILKKHGLEEVDYRDLIRAAFEFINDNVDGVLEDNKRADRIWHMLGAVIARPGDHWTRLEHQESFLRDTKYPDAWEELFRRAR